MSGIHLFSFVIPVHNGMPYIQECLENILSQTYPHFQVIVLENYSSDGTAEYLQSIKNDKITILYSERLLTIEENWARILQLKKAPYMVIACADDCYYPNYLAEIAGLIDRNPGATIFRTHLDIIDSNSKVIGKSPKMPPKMTHKDYLENRLKHTYFETAAGYCIKSSTYDDIGGIDCVHGLMHPDDVLFIRAARCAYLAISESYACAYRTHQKSASATSNMTNIINGYFYFFGWIYAQNEPELNAIVRKYLPVHIRHIRPFFTDIQIKELEKIYPKFRIPNKMVRWLLRAPT